MLSNTALARLQYGLTEPNAAQEIAALLNNPLNDSGNTVFTGTGNVTMAAGQKVAVVNKGTGAATTVTLPPSPVTWQLATVKDGKGDAGTNNITIQPASGNIDGQASVVIKNNYGSMQFLYNGTQWNSINSDFWDGVSDLTIPGYEFLSVTNTITAFSTGGQASATPLTTMINRVTTVAAAGDSVRLPASAAGLQVVINNRGANPCQVYGAGTDTINGNATATGISQGVNAIVVYTCTAAGNWEVPLAGADIYGVATLTTNGAIPPHSAHTYVITKAGVLADTLAAPTAGTDDGLVIRITSDTANAHTLTATGLLDTGSASVNLATFAAQKGAGLTLMAYNGRWKVLSQIGITFT
jgi:hypothetical protein